MDPGWRDRRRLAHGCGEDDAAAFAIPLRREISLAGETLAKHARFARLPIPDSQHASSSVEEKKGEAHPVGRPDGIGARSRSRGERSGRLPDPHHVDMARRPPLENISFVVDVGQYVGDISAVSRKCDGLTACKALDPEHVGGCERNSEKERQSEHHAAIINAKRCRRRQEDGLGAEILGGRGVGAAARKLFLDGHAEVAIGTKLRNRRGIGEITFFPGRRLSGEIEIPLFNSIRLRRIRRFSWRRYSYLWARTPGENPSLA